MDLKTIEFWEHEYLEQIYYLLSIDKQKMLDGFNTKEDIRADWEEFLGNETSDFATGSERIFYWLGKNLLLVWKESYTCGKESFNGLGKNHVMPPLFTLFYFRIY